MDDREIKNENITNHSPTDLGNLSASLKGGRLAQCGVVLGAIALGCLILFHRVRLHLEAICVRHHCQTRWIRLKRFVGFKRRI
jgi:hypothetical protein